MPDSQPSQILVRISIISQVLVAVSIIVAVSIFLVGHLYQVSTDRRDLTFRFLMAIVGEESPIHEANVAFADWIRNGKVFPHDEVEPQEDEIIIRLIDFYDVTADAAMRGIIDKDIVILHLGGRMRGAYGVVEKYTDARRNSLERPMLYKSFEIFVTDYIGYTPV